MQTVLHLFEVQSRRGSLLRPPAICDRHLHQSSLEVASHSSSNSRMRSSSGRLTEVDLHLSPIFTIFL